MEHASRPRASLIASAGTHPFWEAELVDLRRDRPRPAREPVREPAVGGKLAGGGDGTGGRV